MKTQMGTFGLTDTHFCESRIFFRHTNDPGANNCACPKMDDGLSCVPVQMSDAWFAYIGLTEISPTPMEPKA